MNSDDNTSPQYLSAGVCFDVCQKEYDYELNRSIKLDNKINITITFCGIIFLLIIKYVDIKTVFSDVTSCELCYIKMICATSQIVCLLAFSYAIYKLIQLLRTKGYLHFNPEQIFDKNLLSESEDISKAYIATQYLAATDKNNATNEKRSREYDKVVVALIVVLLCTAIVEIMKYNFL